MIWGSKQFRILCEMGFRKKDVEIGKPPVGGCSGDA